MNGRGDGVGAADRECHTAARVMIATIHPLRTHPAGKWTPRPRRLYRPPVVQLDGLQVYARSMLTALTSPPDSRIRDRHEEARLAQAAEMVHIWDPAVVD